MSSPTRPDLPSGLVVTAVLAGLAMIGPFTIDTIFPAFGDVGEDLDASPAAMQQVTSVYLLSFAVMSLFHGPLSDTLGRKPVMVVGLGGYVLASIGCALSPSLPVLLVFRALQGTFAGAGTIVSRAVIRDLYEGPAAQRQMSRVMMLFSIAPAIAPVIGGWLLVWGEWPVIFWFIAGYGLVIALATGTLLPESLPAEDRRPLRLRPLVDGMLEVGRHPAFVRLALATTFVFAAQFVYVVSAPIVVLDLLGKGERDFWMLFVPMIGGLVVGAWLAGRLAETVRADRLVDWAMRLAVVSSVVNVLLVAFAPPLPYAVIGPGLIAVSVATAFPVLQLAMLDLFPHHRGAAASLASFASLVFNALLAGAIAPLVTSTLLVTALSSLGFAVTGLALWTWHRSIGQRAPSAPA